MITSLGTIYWGKPEHVEGIEHAGPAIVASGIRRFSELLHAIRTPARAKKFSRETETCGQPWRIEAASRGTRSLRSSSFAMHTGWDRAWITF
jgi:hypothetical protein